MHVRQAAHDERDGDELSPMMTLLLLGDKDAQHGQLQLSDVPQISFQSSLTKVVVVLFLTPEKPGSRAMIGWSNRVMVDTI